MKMEIKVEKEEVMAIIINHVKLLGGWIHDHDSGRKEG